MKIQINLLPESKKLLAKKKKIFRDVVEQEILFALPFIIFIFMLIGINFILKIQNDSINLSNKMFGDQESYRDLKLYEEDATSINLNVSNIKKLDYASLNWSRAILELDDLLPDGITVVELATSDYKINVIGKADKRESLISLQNNILKSDCFENANVPLSNLVVKNDIDFQVDFDVKKDCLIKK